MTHEGIFRAAAVVSPLFAVALALAIGSLAPSTTWMSGLAQVLILSPLYGGLPYSLGLFILLAFLLRGRSVAVYRKVSLLCPVLLPTLSILLVLPLSFLPGTSVREAGDLGLLLGVPAAVLAMLYALLSLLGLFLLHRYGPVHGSAA